MDLVALVQQQLGQVRPVLAGDPGDQCPLHSTGLPIIPATCVSCIFSGHSPYCPDPTDGLVGAASHRHHGSPQCLVSPPEAGGLLARLLLAARSLPVAKGGRDPPAQAGRDGLKGSLIIVVVGFILTHREGFTSSGFQPLESLKHEDISSRLDYRGPQSNSPLLRRRGRLSLSRRCPLPLRARVGG